MCEAFFDAFLPSRDASAARVDPSFLVACLPTLRSAAPMSQPGIRGLVLPLRINPRRPSSATSSAAESTAPPTPSSVADAELLEVHRLHVDASGALRTERSTPAPPFRLLPPQPSDFGARPRSASPAPDPGPQLLLHPRPAPYTYSGAPSLPPSGSSTFARRPSAANLEGLARAELRGRPLTESALGQRIVNLLCYPWVIAPSGLACVVFPSGTDPSDILEVADHINWLVCGADAYVEVSAGVLGVRNLQKLNALFNRAGLSPIAPTEAPARWSVLAARNPPEFVLRGFQGHRDPDVPHEAAP